MQMTIQLETIINLSLFNNHIYIDNVHALICSIFHALIRYIRYIKRPANALGSMDVISLHSGYQHVLATHGHLQGDERKNTNIIKICLNHSTVLKIM